MVLIGLGCGAGTAGGKFRDDGSTSDLGTGDEARVDSGSEPVSGPEEGGVVDVDGGFVDADVSPEVAPPLPMSERCGDGIRDPVKEECDDGTSGPGAVCTTDCRVVAGVAIAAGAPDGGASRYLGTAPHVAAGTDEGAAVVYEELGTRPSVLFQPMSAAGRRVAPPVDVALGYEPLLDANPAVAALPGGRFAVAWTDGLDGAPTVRLRLVEGATLGPAQLAHVSVAGLHAEPDLLWTGTELVVAYTDLLDVRYRVFSPGLEPQGPEGVVAADAAIESGVTLATFGGGWAAAVRSNTEGLESIVVKSGGASWSTPLEQPGPQGDRPALVALDASHLLVVFTIGTDPGQTGMATIGRLRGAVLTADAPGLVATFPLLERSGAGAAAGDAAISDRGPSAARVGDSLNVAWTSTTAGAADAPRVYLAPLTFGAADARVVVGTPRELPFGAPPDSWRSNVHLAASSLFPGGALISVWEGARDGSSSALVAPALDFRPSPFVFLP